MKEIIVQLISYLSSVFVARHRHKWYAIQEVKKNPKNMELQKNDIVPFDPLANLEAEMAASPMNNSAPMTREPDSVEDLLAMVESAGTSATASAGRFDPLSTMLSSDAVTPAFHVTDGSVVTSPESSDTAKPTAPGKVRELAGLLGSYLLTSSVIFGILLVTMNFSAYSTIVMNWISPSAVKASSDAVIEGLMKSKITAYASESESGAASSAESAEEIKKKLEESNVAIKENVLSPKKLVPAKPQISVDFDVVPYENRLIIPKIGRNIPLVDVESGNSVDFDHMENIFMRELEKGVIRYPGTARPGETGNAFIFGHSSNFPWLPGNYNQVFALLDQLEAGDEIIAYYGQKKYVYVVSEKTVVKPGDVKALSDRDGTKKELSLMTCWPVGTTLKRMLVFAELKSPAPTTP